MTGCVVGMLLVDPAFLLLLIPLALYQWRRWRSPRPTLALATAPFLLGTGAPGLGVSPDLPPRSLRQRLGPLPRLLNLLALLLLVLALSRPAERVALAAAREGIDILLVIDVSSSMRSQDLGGGTTRIEAARDAAAGFVTGRRDDRIGVVTFARYPDLLCPLTLDHPAVIRTLASLDAVAPDSEEDATGLGAALAKGALLLGADANRSRVLILLTDGEETVARSSNSAEEIAPSHAAQLCAQLGVRVQAIAVGLGRRDSSGGWVALDHTVLKDLAARTSGAFHPVRDAGALEEVYRRIDQLERAPIAQPRILLQEYGASLLWVVLCLLLLGRALARGPLEVLP